MANSPLLDSDGVVSFIVLSSGSAIPSTMEIVSIEIESAINRINTATIILNDGDMPTGAFPVSDKETFKPGSEISIQLGYDQAVATVFSGIVIRHSVRISGKNEARLVVECKDKAIAMTVARKNAHYENIKDSDIFSQLIGSYSGLSADVTATTITHKELVQYYCSDWDFMLARAEMNGQLVTLDAGKVSVKAPQTSSAAVLTVTYGTDLIDFRAELDARAQLSNVTASGWDLASHAMVQGQATPQTLNEQGNITSATLASVLNVADYPLQTSVPLDSSALSEWAKAQQIKSGLSRIRGHVSFQGSALAKPNGLLEVAGVGTRFAGSVFISKVQHSVADGDWTTRVEFGLPASWFTETADVMSPPASGITAGINGLHIGVVTKLDADPQSQLRIQVNIPVLGGNAAPVWARLAQFYASSAFGAFFIPEIGDEVILGFFNNDPSHPVVLGSLYSSKNTAAYSLTAENNTKAIVTRSKLKMEYDDDKKVITLVTPAKNTIVISDDGKSILLQDQNSNKVELNSNGITLDSPKDIVLNAKGKISLTATNNIEATSKMDIKGTGLNVALTANVGFTAKGSATAEVSASGTTTIKGAMVMIN